MHTRYCPECSEGLHNGDGKPRCSLHAAAPALLAALELIERSAGFNGGTFAAELQQIARAALRTAKGE